MLKKVLFCAALLIFSLVMVAGCGNGNVNGEAVTASTYSDATYTAVSANANARGFVELTLSIAGDEIVDVTMVEYDGFGNPKDYDSYGREGAFDGSDLQAAHEALAAAMVDNNTYDVDTVSGATGTSGKAVEAAKNALEAAKR